MKRDQAAVKLRKVAGEDGARLVQDPRRSTRARMRKPEHSDRGALKRGH